MVKIMNLIERIHYLPCPCLKKSFGCGANVTATICQQYCGGLVEDKWEE